MDRLELNPTSDASSWTATRCRAVGRRCRCSLLLLWAAVQVLVDDEGLNIRGTCKAPDPNVGAGRRQIRWTDVTDML